MSKSAQDALRELDILALNQEVSADATGVASPNIDSLLQDMSNKARAKRYEEVGSIYDIPHEIENIRYLDPARPEYSEMMTEFVENFAYPGATIGTKITAKIVKRGADSAVSSKPFDKFLQSESGNVITKDLIIDGKAAGYIQGKITPMGISVNLISIDKKYQRLGFGTDLYKSLQKETTGLVYSHGWQQNPETAAKVWKSLVKSDVAEMIPSEMEPIYFLKKEGVNIKDLLKGATNLPQ